MEEQKMINWSLAGLWNEQLTFGRDKRELKVRDRMWASELGKDHYERWLKMNAIKPDFDYEERILRKFEAGNFFERVVGFVLMSAGILMHDNKWHEIPADKDHLAISVKPDFIAGGKPDWRKAEEEISRNMLFELMPNLGRIAKSLVEYFSEKYPDGLDPLVFEIKSVNSQVFWSKKDYLGQAYPHHLLQTFAEMKATGLPEGRILYISKDDLTVAEFALFANSESLNESYENDVRQMTKYIREGIEPPKPADFIFDERKKLNFQHNKEKYKMVGCYTENWQIEWSQYITKITGIKGKDQKDVVDKWKKKIAPAMKIENDKLKSKFKENL